MTASGYPLAGLGNKLFACLLYLVCVLCLSASHAQSAIHRGIFIIGQRTLNYFKFVNLYLAPWGRDYHLAPEEAVFSERGKGDKPLVPELGVSPLTDAGLTQKGCQVLWKR